MKKRILALIMAVVLVVSLAACGDKKPTATSTPSPTSTTAPTPSPTTKPTQAPAQEGGPASIDFEDGNFGFLAMYRPTALSDKSDLQIITLADGTKALWAENVMKKNETHIGVDLDTLLGDKIAEVKTIKIDIASKSADDKFNAISGKVFLYSGEGNSVSTATAFSVYIETKNPKTITIDVNNAFVAGQNNYMDIAKLSDAPYEEAKASGKVSNEAVGMVIDNIKFLDASGNLITVDSTKVASASAPFMQEETTAKDEFIYGSSVYMEASNPGDWSKTVDIPASFFEGVTGPVGIVLEVEVVEKPADGYALIGPRSGNWDDISKGFETSFIQGLIDNKDIAPYYFLQTSDNSIVFTDFGTTKVSFMITKEGADFLATHGGLGFIGHEAWVKRAIISYDTFECEVDPVMPTVDWTPSQYAIPASYFAALQDKGIVDVTLTVEIGEKPDYVGFKAATPSWGFPENAEVIICTRDEKNPYYFINAGDPAFSVVDKGITEFSFQLTPEGVKFYAENGGMAFPGHLITVKHARLSSANYQTYMEASNPGDWSKTVDIPASFFEGATGPVGIVLEVEVAEKPADGYALIGPRSGNWDDISKGFETSFIQGLIDNKDIAPYYFLQTSDNSIVFTDYSTTKVSFMITKEGADFLATHGGLGFIGHEAWVKKAYVSTNRFECAVDPVMPTVDWTPSQYAIPAVYFNDAPNGVGIVLNIEIGEKPDYVGFKSATPSWGFPENAEVIVCTRDEKNPYMFINAGDPAFSIVDKGITQVYFELTAEGAAFYAANGGMAFPGHMITVKSAVVTKK